MPKLDIEIINKLGLEFIDPKVVIGSTKFKEGIGIPVGSIRREKEDIGDIDILVTKSITKDDLKKTFGENLEIDSIGTRQIIFKHPTKNVKINIWICESPKEFGGMLVHTTGPSTHNILLRTLAKKFGGKVNQYGVFDKDGNQLAGDTEEEFYKSITTKNYPDGLPWKSMEKRK